MGYVANEYSLVMIWIPEELLHLISQTSMTIKGRGSLIIHGFYHKATRVSCNLIYIVACSNMLYAAYNYYLNPGSMHT